MQRRSLVQRKSAKDQNKKQRKTVTIKNQGTAHNTGKEGCLATFNLNFPRVPAYFQKIS